MKSGKLNLSVAIFFLMVVLAFASATAFVYANPMQFTATASTAAATTSPVFMTPGTATSTVRYDTFQSNGTTQTNTGNTYLTNQTQLLVQFTASSTSSTLNINLEYSQDGIDWYADAPTNVVGYATSTFSVSLNQIPQYQWKFASSTIGQAGALVSNNLDTRSIAVNVPTRYVRAIFTCGAGGTNCTVWSTFIPVKEIK
jgi:hypothetical protein